ncbi:hypothetical protein GCM10027589_03180 [Actinocorallia lasiicapitis]
MSAIFEWATPENLQPEPITEEIWRELPEDFCRLVEVVNGQAIRCDSPTREHQSAVARLTEMLDANIDRYVSADRHGCVDVSMDFDVRLWRVPFLTIRRPDVALFSCSDERPLPAQLVKVVIEVVSGNGKAETADKMGEYALAGIPWYWLVWLSGNEVASVDVHVLDHTVGQYRKYRTFYPEEETLVMDAPFPIRLEWSRLARLTR